MLCGVRTTTPATTPSLQMIMWSLGAAPWATTDAYMHAVRESKAVLKVDGPLDPTGGFEF